MRKDYTLSPDLIKELPFELRGKFAILETYDFFWQT